VLGDPTRVVLLQLHLAIQAPTRGYLSIQQCTSSNGEKGSKNEKGFSPLSRVEETYVVRDHISYLGHCTASIISHREV